MKTCISLIISNKQHIRRQPSTDPMGVFPLSCLKITALILNITADIISFYSVFRIAMKNFKSINFYSVQQFSFSLFNHRTCAL